MKLLLDENLPKKLKFRLIEKELEVWTVQEMGWSSLVNGALIKALLENNFDGLITVDKNLRFQQNLSDINLKLIVLNAQNNRYETLLPFVNSIVKSLRDKPEADLHLIEI